MFRNRNEEDDWIKYVHNLWDKTEIEEQLDQEDLAEQCRNEPVISPWVFFGVGIAIGILLGQLVPILS